MLISSPKTNQKSKVTISQLYSNICIIEENCNVNRSQTCVLNVLRRLVGDIENFIRYSRLNLSQKSCKKVKISTFHSLPSPLTSIIFLLSFVTRMLSTKRHLSNSGQLPNQHTLLWMLCFESILFLNFISNLYLINCDQQQL